MMIYITMHHDKKYANLNQRKNFFRTKQMHEHNLENESRQLHVIVEQVLMRLYILNSTEYIFNVI